MESTKVARNKGSRNRDATIIQFTFNAFLFTCASKLSVWGISEKDTRGTCEETLKRGTGVLPLTWVFLRGSLRLPK